MEASQFNQAAQAAIRVRNAVAELHIALGAATDQGLNVYVQTNDDVTDKGSNITEIHVAVIKAMVEF